MQLYLKETPTQVFSCEYREIFKSSFFYRTTPVAVSKMTLLVAYPDILTHFRRFSSFSFLFIGDEKEKLVWNGLTEYMRCFARFSTIFTISKTNTHWEMLLLMKLQAKACNLTKSNTRL